MASISSTAYASFSEVPLIGSSTGRFEPVIVSYVGADPDAPVTASGTYRWNVLSFGSLNRQTQIAFCVFGYRNYAWFRQKHDSVWYGWYKLIGGYPEFTTLMVSAPSTASGSAYCNFPDSSWNYKNTVVVKSRCLHKTNSAYYENAVVCSQIATNIRLVFANSADANAFLSQPTQLYLMKMPL